MYSTSKICRGSGFDVANKTQIITQSVSNPEKKTQVSFSCYFLFYISLKLLSAKCIMNLS